jgi:hypothetical protein
VNDDIDDDEEMAHIRKKIASLKKKADELSTKVANRFYSPVSTIDEKSEVYRSSTKTLPDEKLGLPKGKPAIPKEKRERLFQCLAIKVESTTIPRDQVIGASLLLTDTVLRMAMEIELLLMKQLSEEYGSQMIFNGLHSILRYLILLRDPKIILNATFKSAVLTSELTEKIFGEWFRYFSRVELPSFMKMQFLRMDKVFDHYVDVFLHKAFPDTPYPAPPPSRRVLYVHPR